MKRFFLSTVLLILLPLVVHSQDIRFSEEDIVGRWIEVERIKGDKTTEITVNNDTYIFRENLIFHKGESSEGLILFNIAGKFSIEGNCITIIYKDYLDRKAKNQKAKTVKFEVLFIDESKNELIVNVIDYDYEYRMKLKRQ